MAVSPSSAAGERSFNTRAMIISLLITAIFDIGLAIAAFEYAKRVLGVGDFAAYLIASIGPLVGMAIGLLRTRKLGGVSLIILAQILISALVTLIGAHDPRALLLKDSVLTGTFGLVVLITSIPIFPKPLMFFFGLKFGTDGTQEGTAYWYQMWDKYPEFRRVQRFINNVWGIGFMTEAVIKAIGVFVLPYEVAYAVNQIAPFVLLIGLITWTISYSAKARRRGEARAAAAAAADAEREPA
jgi:hypothetical protein